MKVFPCQCSLGRGEHSNIYLYVDPAMITCMEAYRNFFLPCRAKGHDDVYLHVYRTRIMSPIYKYGFRAEIYPLCFCCFYSYQKNDTDIDCFILIKDIRTDTRPVI